MQTNFTPEQLKDPATARSNQILRTCVHCGFCTATCPTYQVLGDELDSPRGRIYLIKDMLEAGRPADEKTVKHIDRCLSCLACMTTCPSGVHYMHLVDHARAHIEATYRRPWRDRALRWLLKQVIPHPGRFRLALAGAKLARPFARLMPDARLRAMLAMAPKTIPPVSRNDDGQTFPAIGERRARVALMIGCAQRALNTEINDATIRLLRRAGCEVVIPEKFGCCGALTLHMGQQDDAKTRARDSIARLLAAERDGALDAIIINTSGCGTTVKDYGHLFENDDIAAEAARVSGLTRDVTEFLEGLGLPDRARTEGQGARVAYHSACSLQHGQQIKSAPGTLLTRAGFRIVEPADPHLCCGSAGTYNLLQPELSSELKRRKVATLEATSPQIIAAGNIGCMMQIGGATDVPVVHTVQLLDWATGGPRPDGLGAIA
ncbi:glycolate oxidase subunit GlcF [Paracoccus sp. R12_1]|uniref:glycolate oxidase subunit GlcF n=1 Tax=unclassified Paracoccus (in: a-proteobacteria) TaxID=2688777 RepID=UPI001ADCD8DF|nr:MULTISPECIES: glycolate oxidase subunit GlcF [unclassified Paracoccus (in: a-proteobacteria)]MBO9456772.1 glycolate oxidase subunit GlcF [Paracoccus sp. R12_2]MBO9487868.1 glycolate oxidase subunit GlcF [Paracoccus sp. R12_1]